MAPRNRRKVLMALNSGTHPPTPGGVRHGLFQIAKNTRFFASDALQNTHFFSPAARSFMRDNAQIHSQKSKNFIAPSARFSYRQIRCLLYLWGSTRSSYSCIFAVQLTPGVFSFLFGTTRSKRAIGSQTPHSIPQIFEAASSKLSDVHERQPCNWKSF